MLGLQRTYLLITVLFFFVILPSLPERSGPPKTDRLSLMTHYLTLGSLNLLLNGAVDKAIPDKPVQKPERAIPLGVGQWVKYQVKRYEKDKPEDYPTAVSDAELKLSIVDKTTLYEKELYWVEIVLNENKEPQRLIKFLINKQGSPQPEKLILKYGNLQPVEINLRIWEVKTRVNREILFEEIIHNLNIIPFTRVINPEDKIGEEQIPVNIAGQENFLNCLKVSFAEPKYNPFGKLRAVSPAEPLTGAIWYSDQVPLAGLVKFFFIEDKYRTMIFLSGYDTTTGRSLINDEEILPLDFK